MISNSKTMPIAICLIIFRTCMNIIFIMKVKIFVLIKWLHRSPQSSLEWLSYFEHMLHSFWAHLFMMSVLRPTLIRIPLKYRWSIFLLCWIQARLPYTNLHKHLLHMRWNHRRWPWHIWRDWNLCCSASLRNTLESFNLTKNGFQKTLTF